MSDIVDELKRAEQWESDGSYAYSQVIKDAIAEIERLRTELAAIRQVTGVISVDYFNYADFKRDLRSTGNPDGEVS
jgi:hypothetical protein